MTESSQPRKIAASLPDLPRHVEARGLLLSPWCRVVGPSEGCVVLHTKDAVAALVGRPTPGVLLQAFGHEPAYLELGFLEEHLDLVRASLPDWVVFPGIIHTLDPDQETWKEVNTDGVRLIRRGEWPALEPLLPPDWRAILGLAVERTAVAGSIADDSLVSFCGVNTETESFWDVAVVTLERHRRRGLAAACCAYLIRYMMERGKQPVWGTVEENTASRGLAERLGFVPVDRTYVAVFRKELEARRGSQT